MAAVFRLDVWGDPPPGPDHQIEGPGPDQQIEEPGPDHQVEEPGPYHQVEEPDRDHTPLISHQSGLTQEVPSQPNKALAII